MQISLNVVGHYLKWHHGVLFHLSTVGKISWRAEAGVIPPTVMLLARLLSKTASNGFNQPLPSITTIEQSV